MNTAQMIICFRNRHDAEKICFEISEKILNRYKLEILFMAQTKTDKHKYVKGIQAIHNDIGPCFRNNKLDIIYIYHIINNDL